MPILVLTVSMPTVPDKIYVLEPLSGGDPRHGDQESH
jgi:hypothetical protein